MGKPAALPQADLRGHPRTAGAAIQTGRYRLHLRQRRIEAALEQARAAAGEKNVGIWGGASILQQYPRAGLLGELQIHPGAASIAS
jgi:hypothetical protein